MSNDNSASIVSKVWNYAHVLKNAGVGYGDYVEQITYLLFLKLAEEMTELGFENLIPEEFQWSELSSRSGDDLEVHYRHTLESLGKESGLVGLIFRKAQNKISNPSDLARVIKMIADEDWSGMDVDIKGAIYEDPEKGSFRNSCNPGPFRKAAGRGSVGRGTPCRGPPWGCS